MKHAHASMWDFVGAYLLLGWAIAMWAAVVVLIVADRRGYGPRVWRGAATLVLIGVVGQIGHFQEHVAQVGYWVAHPNSPAWMTPWANGLASGYGAVDTSKPPLGMEILHFVGNMIFLAGMVGILVITNRARHVRARKWGRMGVWMQGLHGLEHLALMLTVWLGASKAIGLSTFFGQLDAGSGLVTYRVWWHFLANVAGTAVFATAVWFLWRDRREIEASFGNSESPVGRGRHAVTPEPVLVGSPA